MCLIDLEVNSRERCTRVILVLAPLYCYSPPGMRTLYIDVLVTSYILLGQW
jgi:hypothetical protein